MVFRGKGKGIIGCDERNDVNSTDPHAVWCNEAKRIKQHLWWFPKPLSQPPSRTISPSPPVLSVA